MIRTWFSTNTVMYQIFLLCIEIDNQYGRPMISDREIALLSNQLVFFYCNHCKGLSGSISFPGQLSFSVRNRVLRESFFTKYVQNASYWHLSLSVCTINPTYRNLFTTSSLWHFLLPDHAMCTWSSYHSLQFL